MNTQKNIENADTTKQDTKTLKIIIFGATGGTGRHLVDLALDAGHKVLAFDRQPGSLPMENPNLTFVKGDVFDEAQVEEAIAGQDVVINVLGVPPGVTIPVCSKGTENIIAAMQKTGVRRLICQSAFVVAAMDGHLREVPLVLPILLALSPKNKVMFADKLIQERAIKASELDWTIVRSARLTNDNKMRNIVAREGLLFHEWSSISREEIAHFIMQQVQDRMFVRKTVGVHRL